MADALAKFEARKLNDEWSTPTKEQGQILALTAQVELLTKSSKKAPSKPNPPKTGKKGKDKNKWAWKEVLPKQGEPRTKDFGGKHYHVDCKYHPDQWVCHSTAECSKNPANDGTPPAKPETSSTERRLQGAQLANSITDDSGNTEEESDGDDF